MAFIDYRKAFDSVEHTKIIDSMEAIAIHPKYIRLIREVYKNSNAKVRTEIKGEMFRTKRGVGQGDSISPKLFTCLLEIIFRKLNWNRKRVGININGRRLSNLRFADDIVIFAKSTTELQEIMTELNTRSKEMGLLMNPSKTKIMTNYNRWHTDPILQRIQLPRSSN
jgi:retron-type reverse transcriptase